MRIKTCVSTLLLLVSFCSVASAQNVVVKGTLTNIATTEITISRSYKNLLYDHFKEGWITVPVKDGQFSVSLTVDLPEMMSVSFTDSNSGIDLSQILFLAKGYDLNIRFTLKDKIISFQTSGKGANDNQQLNVNPHRDFQPFYKIKDTISTSFFNYISNEHKSDSISVAAYIKKNHPSAAFISTWKYNLMYQVVNDFHGYSENMKFYIKDPYLRNHDQWVGLQDHLFAAVPLSNDAALMCLNYLQLTRMYVLRKKEKLWTKSREDKMAFLTEWYGADTAKARKEFEEDMENKLCQKIIERDLSGQVKEYAYAVLMESALQTSNIKNMQAIYADFIHTYPASKFRLQFEPEFTSMFDRTKHPLTDKMLFVKDGGKIDNWETVLALVKGKTVLLDMWGTWCGPCREEMEKNGVAIKAHFKEKGLDYLYIANLDEEQEKKWKELIAYFNLEGSHILANGKLNKDIMDKIKGTGYPTYAIIHRDGSVELSKAGYPMNREKLIAQIEAALKP